MVQKLSQAERKDLFAALPAWAPVEGRDAIERSFSFKDFKQAWGFMTQVALAAEQLDHHPEWSNVYNRVQVVLTTHSCGGLSALDARLAHQIDAFATTFGA